LKASRRESERNVLRGDKKLAGNVSVARAPREKKIEREYCVEGGIKRHRRRTTKGENGGVKKNFAYKTSFGRRAAKKH